MYSLENSLYPPINAYNSGFLDVGDGHSIYYEESGNPYGIPLLIFHGGPGYWSTPNHRRYANPKKYRTILYHQRGCGLSKPLGSLENNETHHLLSDVDKLLDHLDVPKALLMGGSWGSTMSLLYAQHNPVRTLGLVIYGVYLGDQEWTDWYLEKSGASLFFPEAYTQVEFALRGEDGDTVAQKTLNAKLKNPKSQVGKAIVNWETRLVTNDFSLFTQEKTQKIKDVIPDEKIAECELAAGLIEMHYLAQNCFIEEKQILKNIHKISHLPAMIVQGRYDMVCPPKQAWLVHQKWSHSILKIIGDAGHHSRELRPYLVKALDVFDEIDGFDVLKSTQN